MSNGSKRSSSPKESSNPASDEDQTAASHQQDHQSAEHGEVTAEDRHPVAGPDAVVTGTDRDEPHPQTGAVGAPWPASVAVHAVPTVIVCPREPALRPRRVPSAALADSPDLAAPPQIGEARSQGIRPKKSVVIMDYPQQQGYPQPAYYHPQGYPPQGYTAPGQYPYPPAQQPYYHPQPQQQRESGACASCCRSCCSLCAGWASCVALMPCIVEHAQNPDLVEDAQGALGNIAGQATEGLGNIAGQATEGLGNIAGQAQEGLGNLLNRR